MAQAAFPPRQATLPGLITGIVMPVIERSVVVRQTATTGETWLVLMFKRYTVLISGGTSYRYAVVVTNERMLSMWTKNLSQSQVISKTRGEMAKQIHVVKRGNSWVAKQDKAQRASVVAPTQQEAFERAREIAKKQGEEVTIHNTMGRIRAKHSYGEDPFPPEG